MAVLSESCRRCFTDILQEELLPSMGCTEPIAIALAAAVARQALGEAFTSLRVLCSANIIKNAKSVVIPNTGGLIGIEAAALAGAIGGDANAGMEVLAAVTSEQKKEIAAALQAGKCNFYHLNSDHVLHIVAEIAGAEHTAKAEIADGHDNIVLIERDGEVLRRSGGAAEAKAPADRSQLTMERIKEYADTTPMEILRPLLEPQVRLNGEIAGDAAKGDYGLNYGKSLLRPGADLYERVVAYTAASSEARMAGCSRSVVINSGSGNQGITASVPAIIYCRGKGYSEETLYRALALSNLVTIYQKSYIGKLSAFCGAISAACGSGASLTYADGGTLEMINDTVDNMLAITAGIVCDGAKLSCAAKVATAMGAAVSAHQMAMEGKSYKSGEGIVCEDADETIRAVGRIARDGMRDTDDVIISVMMHADKDQ